MEYIEKGAEGSGNWKESCDCYHNGYTNYINKELMPKCIKEFSDCCSNEYYKMDVAGWDQLKDQAKDVCEKVKMNA